MFRPRNARLSGAPAGVCSTMTWLFGRMIR